MKNLVVLSASLVVLLTHNLQNAAAQSCLTPPLNLLAWWTGDGTSVDLFGTNHATLVNGATFASGKVAQAFSFNGVNSYAQVPDSPSLHLADAFTILAWINPAVVPTQQYVAARILEKGTPGGVPGIGGDGITLDLYYGYLRAIINNLGIEISNRWHLGTTPIQPNVWTHVALSFDGFAMRQYVNGVLDGAITNYYPMTVSTNSYSWLIGADHRAGSFFNGLIDELSMFKRTLTAQEINAIYTAGVVGMCKDPLILVQPGGQGRGRGQNATFTVQAKGTGTLSYQWTKDDVPISGATQASLVVTNVQTANEGIYSVAVSNTVGRVVSCGAPLVVVSETIDLYAGLTVYGLAGETYGIQYRTNLEQSNWLCLTNVTLTSPAVMWFDSDPVRNASRRFYRVVTDACTNLSD